MGTSRRSSHKRSDLKRRRKSGSTKYDDRSYKRRREKDEESDLSSSSESNYSSSPSPSRSSSSPASTSSSANRESSKSRHLKRKSRKREKREGRRHADTSPKTERAHKNSDKTKVSNKKDDSKNAETTEIDEAELQEYMNSKISKVTVECIGRAGGVYIPPFKLARLQEKVEDDTGNPVYQRTMWEALRKSLNGLINKLTVQNIRELIPDIFKENLIWGRGLFARGIIRAQMASPGFTNVYSAIISVVNSKLPDVGNLVLKRVILQFRRSYRMNDKIVCIACVQFLAHLINQRVAGELLALQISTLLLERLTDDSVEVCVTFLQECGLVLSEITPIGFNAITERLRGVLHEGETNKRVQYTIERFFDVVRLKFNEFPGVLPELDLVEDDDKITHELSLDDPTIEGEGAFNRFKAKTKEHYDADDAEWRKFSKEVLDISDEEKDEGDENSTSEDSEGEDEMDPNDPNDSSQTVTISDYTEQELINIRKSVYLQIMSSASFEECVHKLLKLNIKEGAEIEICTMLIDCAAMERTFQLFYALQAERLSKLKPAYQEGFMSSFIKQYHTVHRLDTNKLRNTAKLFAHLLHTDAMPWTVFELFELTEEKTTSASRIFIKIILLELSEHLGIKKLNERLHDPIFEPYVKGLFPTDNARNIRFAVNFFTAIGLGGLTDDLRKLYTQTPAK